MAPDLEDLIRRADRADREAIDKLFAVLYHELHRLAERNLRRAGGRFYDAKYAYWLIRPYKADRAITTPIGRPNHPSYPSSHACSSGASAYVLGAIFPSDAAELAAMADEAGESRLYAGLHYRFDKDAALGVARQVSALALRRGAGHSKDDE